MEGEEKDGGRGNEREGERVCVCWGGGDSGGLARVGFKL